MNDDNTTANDNENINQDVVQDSAVASTTSIHENWIKVVEGKFICSECENESQPETNTVDGTVTADVEQIKADLNEFPTKIVYGICPVCGMEFVFKLDGEDLYLEPSELEK